MKKNDKTRTNKWKIYLAIVGVIVGIDLAVSVLSTVVSYPTADHRQTAQQLNDLNQRGMNGEDIFKITESKEYKSLSSSPNNVYTNWALGLTFLLQAIIFVTVIFQVYRYLRKRLITEHPVGITVLLYSLALLVTMIPTYVFTEWFTGVKANEITMIVTLIAAPFTVLLSVLITFLVAKIAEWQYNRSHGFLAD